MCRMIAGAGVVSVRYLVDGLQSMAESGHRKGWGVAYRSDGHVVAHKSPLSCLEDEGIKVYRSLLSDLVVFHARNTFKEPSLDATHPVDIGPYLLFHNTRFNEGSHDPRRLVDYLREFLVPGDEEASLARALSNLGDFDGANCMLVELSRIIVASRFERHPEYYQMAYSVGRGDFVVGSKPLEGREWCPLPNRSVLTLHPDSSHERITF